jgi:predicted membrane protein
LLIFFAAKEKAPLPILTLIIACITQVVMGFSPTIFQSGVRTISLLYYALLIIIIWIVIENRHIFSKKFLYCITILFGVYLISEYFPYIH